MLRRQWRGGGPLSPGRQYSRGRGVRGGFRAETDEEEGYIYRGVLGGRGESGRSNPVKIGIPAVVRANSGRSLRAEEEEAGPTGQCEIEREEGAGDRAIAVRVQRWLTGPERPGGSGREVGVR